MTSRVQQAEHSLTLPKNKSLFSFYSIQHLKVNVLPESSQESLSARSLPKMPVPFGFNIGDITIAMQLLSKVYKSLKDTGGAASEYHEVSQFLQGLILTLQHLEKIELVCGDPSRRLALQPCNQSFGL